MPSGSSGFDLDGLVPRYGSQPIPDFRAANEAWSPLGIAAFAGHAECVTALLEAPRPGATGASVDLRTCWGDETPLLCACYRGREEAARLLLAALASPGQATPDLFAV